MKITDFEDLIRHLPYLEQAFRINKEVWFPTDIEKRFKNQDDRIQKVFADKNHKMISRYDIFNSTQELDLFVIQVLMWGYPTKGRGKNIENILEPINFNLTIEKLEAARQKDNIKIEDVIGLCSRGLKLSTISKFLYFLKIRVENFPALILDLRVIAAITREDGFNDNELMDLKNMNYDNALTKYSEYLRTIEKLAKNMNVHSDQIEMFLFEYGNTLKGHDGN